MARSGLSEWLLERLSDAGAQEAEVFTVEGTTLELQVREGKLERISQAQTGGMGIRTIVGRKLSFVYTSDFSRGSLDGVVEKAVALARQATPDEFNQLPGDKPKRVVMDIFDPELRSMPTKRKTEFLKEMEAAALAYDKAVKRVDGASYFEYWGRVEVANTHGVSYAYDASTCGVNVEAVAEKDGGMETGYAGWNTRHFHKIPAPAVLGREAAGKAVALLGAGPVASQRVPVVFSRDAGFALLASLTQALQGDNVNKKVSYLGERLGEKIGSDLVTIHSNGRLPEGPGSIPVDAEGVATTDLVLFDKGVLKNFAYDYSSALKAGKKSTGSAVRGDYRNVPAIGMSNYYLERGTRSPTDIIKSTQNGLYVMKLSGWWMGISPASSEFSSAASGRWIRNGELAEPVSRVTIASTLPDMLAGMDAVADDLEFRNPTGVPTFRVREMALSGATEDKK
jgi:PmbA protein